MSPIVRYLASLSMYVAIIGSSSCFSLLPKNRYFEYERVEVETSRGKFLVTLVPTLRYQSVNDYLVEVYDGPYAFSAQYYSRGFTMMSGEVTNVLIESVESGEAVHNERRIFDVYRRHYPESVDTPKGMLGFSVKLPEVPYIDYVVSFSFSVNDNAGNVLDSGTVGATLVRDRYDASNRKGAGVL